jgi:glycerate kinase
MFSVIEFEQRLMDADLIVTGEGCLDDTSFNGKIVGEIAALCRAARRPLLVLPGRCRLTSERNARSGDLQSHGMVIRATVLPDQSDPDKRMVKALLYDAAHSAFRDYSKKQLFQGAGI